MFTTNMVGFLVTFIGIFIFHTSPFSALQILWINLVTESLPSIALGAQKPKPYIMSFSPKENNNLVDIKMFVKILAQGIIFSIIALVMFYIVSGLYVNYDYPLMISKFKELEEIENSFDRTNVLNMQMSGSLAAFIVVTFSQSFNGFNLMSNQSICKTS